MPENYELGYESYSVTLLFSEIAMNRRENLKKEEVVPWVKDVKWAATLSTGTYCITTTH